MRWLLILSFAWCKLRDGQKKARERQEELFVYGTSLRSPLSADTSDACGGESW
jgi:hypothetical protein